MESELFKSVDYRLISMFCLITLFLAALLTASPVFACHCTVHGDGESSASQPSEQKPEQEQEQEED